VHLHGMIWALNLEAPNDYTLAIAQLALELFPDEVYKKVEIWRSIKLDQTLTPMKKRLSEIETSLERISAKSDRTKILFGLARATSLIAIFLIPMVVISTISPLYNLFGKIFDYSGFFSVIVLGLAAWFIVYNVLKYWREAETNSDVVNKSALETPTTEKANTLKTLEAAEASMNWTREGFYSNLRRTAREEASLV